MTDKEIYLKWASLDKKWVDWVRPVPFIGINECYANYNLVNLTIPTICFLNENFMDAAVVVDLPGSQSVETGIALAKMGYRPIPIYNGTIEQKGSRATVDNHTVRTALKWGAFELDKIDISDNALPAFLLDSNRINRYKMDAALFDNSWDVYHQDMPSADYFIQNGIYKIILLSERLSEDICKILYKYQTKGMKIFWTKGYEIPRFITVNKPLRVEDR